MAKFNYQSSNSTRPVFKFLLLQTIIIKPSLYCDKVANFDASTHKPELCLLLFCCFLFSVEFEKSNKYNSELCVFVPKFATYFKFHNNTMKSQL